MHRAPGYIIFVLVLAGTALAPPVPIPLSQQPVPTGTSARTVLIFLPQQLFSGEEFEPALAQLTRAGLQTRIAAMNTGIASSLDQVLVNTDITLRDAGVSDYAGLVLVGGSGAALYWDDSLVQAKCREFADNGKVVAAIGIAPVTLARAGVLKGHTAAVFHDRDAINWLKQGGARFSFKNLVIDRNIITAATDDQARAFGKAVASAVLETR
ncbi:MAG TPA: DJ-1/PfpI family protein [bacterium]|nr:DJ-1/PfpI family protein [bacterium]